MHLGEAFKSLGKTTAIFITIAIILIGIILIVNYVISTKYYELDKTKTENIETYDLINKNDYNFMIVGLVVGIIVLLVGAITGVFTTYNIFKGRQARMGK